MKQARVSYTPGERLEGTVERMVPGGAGLVRGHKGIVLVDRAAPGDVALIQVESVRSGVPRSRILELLHPGPGRIEPPCPWYGRCGGCDLQHLTYAAQIEAKRQIVEDAFARIGGLTLPQEIAVYAAPHPFGSRTRVELHSNSGTHEVGFYERRTRTVVPIDHCMVSSDGINDGLQSIRRSKQPYPGSIRLLAGGGDVRSQPAFPPVRGGSFWLSIGAFEFLADPGSFFQSSLELLPDLIERVTSSSSDGGSTAWDLFCGAGLLSLPLAQRFARVIGVDVDERTIGNARKAAERNGSGNASFFAADVTTWVSQQEGTVAPDLVVVDPPRAGLDRTLANLLAEKSRERLTYVSCDPATLARDLHVLTAGRLRIEDVAIFDLFPQTHHIETVVRLAAR